MTDWTAEQLHDITHLALHRMAFSSPDSEVSQEMRDQALAALRALDGEAEIRDRTVTVGELIDGAAGLGMLDMDDRITLIVGGLICAALGVATEDSATQLAVGAAINAARGTSGQSDGRHEVVPLPGSLRDCHDRAIRTPGTEPGQYPVTGICSSCQQAMYGADITADWCHEADAVKHIVRPKVWVALHNADFVGATSVMLAAATRQPPSMVRTALAALEADGLARHTTPGANRLTWWLATAGGI